MKLLLMREVVIVGGKLLLPEWGGYTKSEVVIVGVKLLL